MEIENDPSMSLISNHICRELMTLFKILLVEKNKLKLKILTTKLNIMSQLLLSHLVEFFKGFVNHSLPSVTLKCTKNDYYKTNSLQLYQYVEMKTISSVVICQLENYIQNTGYMTFGIKHKSRMAILFRK